MKFNAGRCEKDQAKEIGFGLEFANLERILENDPVLICGKDLQISGANFIIHYAGSDRDAYLAELNEVIESVVREDVGDRVNVVEIHVGYVAILDLGEDDITYAIGLHDEGILKLYEGTAHTFRVRHVTGNGESDNLKVHLFASKDMKEMVDEFREVIPPDQLERLERDLGWSDD